MKDYLLGQLDQVADDFQGRRIVREYLQARMLEALQAGGAFASWAFVGETALRFLYALPRFSEDIDFSLALGIRAPRSSERVYTWMGMGQFRGSRSGMG